MPRITEPAYRYCAYLSGEVLDALHARSAYDNRPIAELIRTAVDLVVTFKLAPTRLSIPIDQSPPTKFTAIMPAGMVIELEGEAARRRIEPNELIRQAAWAYMIMRDRVAPIPVQTDDAA